MLFTPRYESQEFPDEQVDKESEDTKFSHSGHGAMEAEAAALDLEWVRRRTALDMDRESTLELVEARRAELAKEMAVVGSGDGSGRSRHDVMRRRRFVLSQIAVALRGDINVTQRDLYYMLPPLFGGRAQLCNQTVADVCRMMGLPRYKLHIVAHPRSVVSGAVHWKDRGVPVSAAQAGISGCFLPANPDHMTGLRAEARWLLVVEDFATFGRLQRDGLLSRLGPGAVLTARGYPDLAALWFLEEWSRTLPHIPVYVLTDGDVYGADIARSYGRVAPVRWLGLFVSQWTRLGLPSSCRAKMSALERAYGERMVERLREDSRLGPQWLPHVEALLTAGEKVELEALASISLSFLTDTLLPPLLPPSSPTLFTGLPSIRSLSNTSP